MNQHDPTSCAPTASSKITSEEVVNGTVFVADDLQCWHMIVQLADKNKYVLLDSPNGSVDRGTCMLVRKGIDEKIMRTQNETRDYLNRLRAKKTTAKLYLMDEL